MSWTKKWLIDLNQGGELSKGAALELKLKGLDKKLADRPLIGGGASRGIQQKDQRRAGNMGRPVQA